MDDESRKFISFLRVLPNVKVETVFSGSSLFVRFTDTARKVNRMYKADLDICEDNFSSISEILNDCALEFCERVYNI